MKSPSTMDTLKDWFGFGKADSALGGDGHGAHGGHGDHGGGGGGHGHTHGTIDPTIATTTKGIWAIKWSFVILAITAAFQFVVVLLSGSVALLADMIHNVGDAVTAIPLWIAFMLARRKPNPRFTYGYGRVEDLAGVAIVMIILASAIVAAYEAIDRLIHPQPVGYLGWITAAGLIGFIGNEVVAVLRIRVGRQINSAALIADGYHARTDGLTSLAVVLGAVGVYLGFPLADPIVGLLITVAIFGIVWQSAKAVFSRMLDGVDPEITTEIRHAAAHVEGVREVQDVRARWLGHRLVAELDVALDPELSLKQADAVAARFEHEIFDHVPALASARIRVRPHDPDGSLAAAAAAAAPAHAGHGHHAPDPVHLRGELAEGVVEIIDTDDGERMRFTAARATPGVLVEVAIARANGRTETLLMQAQTGSPEVYLSHAAPEEPHEFSAVLRLHAQGRAEELPFQVFEPEGHGAH